MTIGATMPGSSRLGFGCAWLRVLDDAEDSRRLLEAAYDAGIRHYDVARSYGYGQAEGIVGSFLHGRRDDVTLVTKLGIVPPRLPRSASAYAVARQLRRVPALHRLARRGTDSAVTTGRFGLLDARQSLETSLRELATDRVDILLLHEVSTADVGDELLGFLRGEIDRGTVRRVGLATDLTNTLDLIERHPWLGDAVLVRSSVLTPESDRLPPAPSRLLMTHSLLGSDLAPLHRWVSSQQPWAEEVGGRLGLDLQSRTALAQLLLAAGIAANPGGITLFSSTSPSHVTASAGAAGRHSAEQVAGFVSAIRAQAASILAAQLSADHSAR